MALKLLATGDLHIGKVSSGINEISAEITTKHSWNQLVEFVIRERFDALILTGDVVDHDNRYFEAIGPLQSGFEGLQKAGISVFIVAGNHDFDVLPQLVHQDQFPNVHLLGEGGKWELKEFSKRGEKIQLAGWSFPQRHYRRDPLSEFDLKHFNPEITTIGLVHGEYNVADSKYAPLLKDHFSATRIDTWILGHIHKQEQLQRPNPAIWYPGSLHALSPKETGVHGPLSITVHPHGEIQINPVAFSPVRYENLAIDISTGVDTESTRGIIISAIKNDFTAKESELDRVKFLSYDITLTGEHNNILMLEKLARNLEENFHQDLNDTKISARRVWIHVNPKVDDMELLAREPSPAGVLARAILALNKNEPNDFVNELIGNWNTEKQRLQRSAMFDMLDETNEHNNSERVNPQKYLLTECNRILTELIQQQHDA